MSVLVAGDFHVFLETVIWRPFARSLSVTIHATSALLFDETRFGMSIFMNYHCCLLVSCTWCMGVLMKTIESQVLLAHSDQFLCQHA
jgi:hypothetical protein